NDTLFFIDKHRVEKVAGIDSFGQPSLSRYDFMVITMSLAQLRKGSQQEYRSWHSTEKNAELPKLIDEDGKMVPLAEIAFFASVPTIVKKKTLEPYKLVNDQIIFSQPNPRAKYLYLELPLGNVGGKEKVTFRFSQANERPYATARENLSKIVL